MATEKLGITIEKNPPESKLTELGVRNWPKWKLVPVAKFPWTFTKKETCYLVAGKVKVTPDGSDESVEIEEGDLVVFPKGYSCTWDVSVPVDKHYYHSDASLSSQENTSLVFGVFSKCQSS
ncbi:unnamed protein product, partial [Thlaspi arvense]